MFRRIWVLTVLTVLLLTSCNNGGCYDTMDVKVYCSFYSQTLKKAVQIDSVTVWGVGSDSLIYSNETVSELALELNPKVQETKYVVQAIASGYLFKDTLTLKYTNQPWFQSMECGCMVFSTLESIVPTGTIFQSATILNPKIINQKTKHVVLNI
ncbi:MAG: DUF6452 family protein [Bacteroidales bacterium]